MSTFLPPSSFPLQIPDRGCDVPRTHEHEGSGRADAQRAKQELFLLRRVDPQQRQGKLRNSYYPGV